MPAAGSVGWHDFNQVNDMIPDSLRGVHTLVKAHHTYRAGTLNLIASENAMSPAVEALVRPELSHRYGDYTGADPRAWRYTGNRYLADAVCDLPALGPLRASGPLGEHRSLGQTRADIYGREIIRCASAEDAASLAAMLIATCAVTGEDPYALMQRRREVVWRALPRHETAGAYDRAYQRYQIASAALSGFDLACQELDR